MRVFWALIGVLVLASVVFVWAQSGDPGAADDEGPIATAGDAATALEPAPVAPTEPVAPDDAGTSAVPSQPDEPPAGLEEDGTSAPDADDDSGSMRDADAGDDASASAADHGTAADTVESSDDPAETSPPAPTGAGADGDAGDDAAPAGNEVTTASDEPGTGMHEPDAAGSEPAEDAAAPDSPASESESDVAEPGAAEPAVEPDAPAPAETAMTLVQRDDGSMLVDDTYVIRGKGTVKEPYEITWDLLVSAYDTYRPREEMKEIPERVSMLHGKYVKISGYYAFPLMMEETDELLVMLNQWDGCCLGVPPTPYDGIEVKLKGPMRARSGMINYATVVGVLKVDPYLVNNWLVGLYLMEDATLEIEM